MKVSISDAARLAGISRQHLYAKYINPGVISVDRETLDKPTIDAAELLRVFPNIKLPDALSSTDGQEKTQEFTRRIAALDSEVTALRQQLNVSQDREKWLQGTVDKLTDTIRLLEHRPADQREAAPRKGFFARIFGGGK